VLPAYDRLPARRPWLAAPLRLRCDKYAPRLRLYSTQSPAAYRVLLETGTLRGDPRFAHPIPNLLEAYAWLGGEMNRRLPTRGETAMWAWARIGWRDLVSDIGLSRGDVLLTLEVAAERVLLHSLDDWEVVLTGGLLLPRLPGESARACEMRTAPLVDAFDAKVEATVGCGWDHPLSSWPADLRQEAEDSWHGIFDQGTWGERGTVQATLHEIYVQDVVRALRIR